MFSKLYKTLRLEFYYRFLRNHKFKRKTRKLKKEYYSSEAEVGCNVNKTVIYMADGRILHGGLGDRLRGICTIFSLCKEKGWDFRIYFNSPFPLEKYLLPNLYDWRISDSEMSYNSHWSVPVYNSCIPEDSVRERRWQYDMLERQLKQDYKQIHCYSSFYFAEDDFKSLFNTLFRPSDEIVGQISALKEKVGTEFITVSLRFLQLLGDFKETKDIYETLDDSRAEKLMSLCLQGIRDILSLKENVGKYAVVTSDSVRFLDYIKEEPSVYYIPGNICHLDSMAKGSDDQLKTFVDFFAVKEAERSYLIVGPGMYGASNFSKRAAQADGREVIIWNIDE